MAQGKLYFIRHATSTYNVASQDYVTKHGTRKHMPLKWDSTYIDSDLTEGGVAEAVAARESLAALDVNLILVSPFKRALHTCELIFGGRNRDVPVRVCPLVSEKCGNAPDVSSFFGEPFPEYSNYDWSEMTSRPHYWLLDNVQNAHTARIDSEATSPAHAQALVLQTMRDLYPEKLESKADIFQRIDRTCLYLQNELRHGNVAVVTHSNFTKHFFLRVFGHPQWMLNCTMLEVNLPPVHS